MPAVVKKIIPSQRGPKEFSEEGNIFLLPRGEPKVPSKIETSRIVYITIDLAFWKVLYVDDLQTRIEKYFYECTCT